MTLREYMKVWKVAYWGITGSVSMRNLPSEEVFERSSKGRKADLEKYDLDSEKHFMLWAKENAASSGVAERSVRWIVDDCMKFVAREIRREKKYDIIIMDPPSYGRGPGGEVWKLENEIYGFIEMCKQVLSDDPLAILVNSYTAGLSPAVMSYILNSTVVKDFGGKAEADEIGLKVSENGLVLPCGSTAVWMK